jgi:hypothetical protein
MAQTPVGEALWSGGERGGRGGRKGREGPEGGDGGRGGWYLRRGTCRVSRAARGSGGSRVWWAGARPRPPRPGATCPGAAWSSRAATGQRAGRAGLGREGRPGQGGQAWAGGRAIWRESLVWDLVLTTFMFRTRP